jgi:hypothetical protein
MKTFAEFLGNLTQKETTMLLQELLPHVADDDLVSVLDTLSDEIKGELMIRWEDDGLT